MRRITLASVAVSFVVSMLNGIAWGGGGPHVVRKTSHEIELNYEPPLESREPRGDHLVALSEDSAIAVTTSMASMSDEMKALKTYGIATEVDVARVGDNEYRITARRQNGVTLAFLRGPVRTYSRLVQDRGVLISIVGECTEASADVRMPQLKRMVDSAVIRKLPGNARNDRERAAIDAALAKRQAATTQPVEGTAAAARLLDEQEIERIADETVEADRVFEMLRRERFTDNPPPVVVPLDTCRVILDPPQGLGPVWGPANGNPHTFGLSFVGEEFMINLQQSKNMQRDVAQAKENPQTIEWLEVQVAGRPGVLIRQSFNNLIPVTLPRPLQKPLPRGGDEVAGNSDAADGDGGEASKGSVAFGGPSAADASPDQREVSIPAEDPLKTTNRDLMLIVEVTPDRVLRVDALYPAAREKELGEALKKYLLSIQIEEVMGAPEDDKARQAP